MLNQLIVYINEEALLGPTVSGFRKGHSTTTSYGTLSVLRRLKNLVPLHEETPGRELSPL